MTTPTREDLIEALRKVTSELSSHVHDQYDGTSILAEMLAPVVEAEDLLARISTSPGVEGEPVAWRVSSDTGWVLLADHEEAEMMFQSQRSATITPLYLSAVPASPPIMRGEEQSIGVARAAYREDGSPPVSTTAPRSNGEG